MKPRLVSFSFCWCSLINNHECQCTQKLESRIALDFRDQGGHKKTTNLHFNGRAWNLPLSHQLEIVEPSNLSSSTDGTFGSTSRREWNARQQSRQRWWSSRQWIKKWKMGSNGAGVDRVGGNRTKGDRMRSNEAGGNWVGGHRVEGSRINDVWGLTTMSTTMEEEIEEKTEIVRKSDAKKSKIHVLLPSWCACILDC